jgi:hypothetical protein
MTRPLPLFCLVAALLACAHAAPLLSDLPMAGDAGDPIYLDDATGASWRLDGPAGSGVTGVRATVPGDLITDLQTANIIGDPLYGLNFMATTWDAGNFTYSRQFAVPAATVAAASSLLLVFDSLKMAAIVELNGAVIGTVTDQFVRPSFDVLSLLNTKAGGVNTLAVTFLPSSHALNDRARFMSCSGAWDWVRFHFARKPAS